MKLAQSLKVPMLRHSIELSLCTVQEVKRSLEFERKRLLKAFLLYQLLIGLLMLAAAIDTLIVPTHCPSSCKLETRPLFSHTCTCAYLAVNCADAEALAAFHGDLAHALAPSIWGDALFYLQISQCSLPTGLDLQLLAPYPNLNVLSIEFSNMTSWDASPNGTWPPSLFAVNLRYGNLSSIPSVLQTPPPTLQTIGLLGHPLQSISPDYEADVAAD
ncbi:hypothetical protein SDRG_15998 [Saprolegnia diclina VS20]|uniref:LRRNT domain-containing protein n=1 Tax=Saprolegnia diclina (strain VS20) TaxID=1156394 RepID=T0PV65_SAPDV|nr:hypothetical protein SDRG_15998 [Saprolegnia diclina VS20]EQC26146.1 hypothetical protein SDRG_15998 [Saprolegnia diclina VS20]|eukprot:XP_008620409.1 hypothetical protein SDRG_15998 [Saprolegnia diclina VS20]